MGELELTRTPGDRRLYALPGVGTVRLKGWTAGRCAGPSMNTSCARRANAALDPGLLLFTAFVVRGLAEDASSSSGAGSAGT